MNKFGLILILTALCFANLPQNIDYVDGESTNKTPLPPMADRVLIAPIGDIRAILGPQGKNIVVSEGGEAIAVIYGDPTTDPDNYMEIKIAYSLDNGATWITYGPFSPETRRVYPGVDGSPDFDAYYGELYFSWQESPFGYATGDHKVMIEEGIPSASSPSIPASLPSAYGPDICPWFTCVAVDPDDPYDIISTSLSYLNNGNENCYAWVSEDGGYTWTDTIFVYNGHDPISGSSGAGHCRRGPGDYAFMTFHDTIDVGGTAVTVPHIIESTDGGFTWGTKETLPVPYVTPASQFWWTELDCEVINGEPWAVHYDLTSDSMWLFHGTGSPGSWTWEVFNIRQLGTTSQWINDTLYESQPSQYSSLSYDPLNNIILVSYKANYYVGDTLTWATHNGAHIGGVYTTDNGVTWTICDVLSTPNTGEIVWANWSGTEVAHHIVDGWTYGCWANEVELNLYFERAEIQPFPPVGIEETSSNSIISYNFSVLPTITSNRCCAAFTMPKSGNITLKLFDATGRLIRTAYQGQLEKGAQEFDVNTLNLTNGAYFLVLKTESGSDARKFIKF